MNYEKFLARFDGGECLSFHGKKMATHYIIKKEIFDDVILKQLKILKSTVEHYSHFEDDGELAEKCLKKISELEAKIDG